MKNEHHHYGPSTLHALHICPRFINDESRDTSAADAGTRIHKAVEINNPDMLVDDDERLACMKALMVKQQLQAEYPEAITIQEMKVASSLNHGTADLVMVDLTARLAVVYDWKFGRVKVPDPEFNIQLLNYAYNVFAEIPEVNTIKLGVFQPYVSDEAAFCTVERAAMPSIKIRIDAITANADDPPAEPVPNDNCQYCGNKSKCYHWTNAAAVVLRENEGLVIPETWDRLVDYDPEELSQHRACIGILEDLLKQLKKEMTARAAILNQQGQEIPGYSLQHRKGSLGVKDTVALYNKLKHTEGIQETELIEKCVKLSAKSCVELLTDHSPGVAAAGVELELTALGLVERGQGSTVLMKKRNADLKQLASGQK